MNYEKIKYETNFIFSHEYSTFKKIMDEHEEQIKNIKMNHDIHNCTIRTLKDIISPTKEIIEDKLR
jgi:hypothetical protein